MSVLKKILAIISSNLGRERNAEPGYMVMSLILSPGNPSATSVEVLAHSLVGCTVGSPGALLAHTPMPTILNTALARSLGSVPEAIMGG